MKFNFKKIASVLTSTVMLSSTVAFAAAASFPEPFVEDGSGDFAIVVGSTQDNQAALNINDYLTGMVDDMDTTTTVTTVDGESFRLDKANDKFNLGERLNSIHTSLDVDDLPNVLADGVFNGDDDEDYDYEQEITLGSVTLSHFANDDNIDPDEKPVIGFNIADGTNVLNYTLDFSDQPANITDVLATSYIEILGKEYYISDVDTGSVLKLTLLDSANTATVEAGEVTTVTVGDESYDVELINVGGTNGNEATLSIDGDKLDATAVGNTKKYKDVYVSILETAEADYAGDVEYVEFSIGSGEIELEDGQELIMNDVSISEIIVNYTLSSGKIDKINLIWTTDEEEFLSAGNELEMPGLGGLKLVVGDFIAEDEEELGVARTSDDYIGLENLEVKDGKISSLPVLYANSSSTGYEGLGEKAADELVTVAGTNPTITVDEDKNSRFVATYYSGDEWESYVFEVISVNKVDDQNETKIESLGSGDTYTFTNDDSTGDEEDFGEIVLTVTGDESAGTATVVMSGGVYADRIVTNEGLLLYLPVHNVSVASQGGAFGNNQINLTAGTDPTSFRMDFKEADEDDKVGDGLAFNITLGFNSDDGPEVSSVAPEGVPIEDGSDTYEVRVPGSDGHATKIVYDSTSNQDDADITYYGEEAYAEVFIAESAATSSSGGDISGTMIVMTDEIEDVDSKNLIVVGGTCVNSVAADVLGVASQFPLCGADWTELTGVGPNEFLIQTVASPYASDKVAMLVAGYERQETINAANAVKTEDIDTTAGKKYKLAAGSTLSLV